MTLLNLQLYIYILNFKKSTFRTYNFTLFLLQFVFPMALFLAYYVAEYMLDISFLNNIEKIVEHMTLIEERPALVRYVLVFALEGISVAKSANDSTYELWRDFAD
jgi:hypothetical protein